MKINNKHVTLLLCVCIWTLLLMPAVFAASGDANAGQKPLNFLSATFNGINLQGAVDVPLDPKITMEFDKDIVNAAVWNNNSNCFSLQSANNENVQINVTKIDDTVDFNQRTKVFIEPVLPLKPGTIYYLKCAPNLLAKNGNSTLAGTTGGAGVTVSFTTFGQPLPASGQTNNQNNGGSGATNSPTTNSPTTNSTSSTTTNTTTLNSGGFSLTKATAMLTRVVGVLQAVLMMGSSLAQFHQPLT